MTAKQTREAYQATESQFFKEAPHIKAGRMMEILDRLHRYEATLSRIGIAGCNRDLTAQEIKKEASTEVKVQEIMKELGFTAKTGGDPRGYMIRIYLPSKRSNSFDGESWRINW